MGIVDWLRRLLMPTAKRQGTSPFAPGMGPSRLILLRHAEKTGDKRDPHLSGPGTTRAARLVDYIPATFGRPDFLIAARTSRRSRRPVETLEPLAAALALPIDAELDDEDIDALVLQLGKQPQYRGKRGVISWRHSDLPRLATALGAPRLFPGDDWASDDYTSLIDVTYAADGTAVAKRVTMPF